LQASMSSLRSMVPSQEKENRCGRSPGLAETFSTKTAAHVFCTLVISFQDMALSFVEGASLFLAKTSGIPAGDGILQDGAFNWLGDVAGPVEDNLANPDSKLATAV